jgi:hypothetical protein
MGDNERYGALLSKFDLNVSRFAAYKAYDVQQQISKLNPSDPAYESAARGLVSIYNGYGEVEIKAVVTRVRNARQWVNFEEQKELYPNLRWLPSNAVHPREEHKPFYNKVIPKSDPFWRNNQPGNIWGCKCGWEETTDAADIPAERVSPSRGLSGNPAESGDVFSSEASYFEKHKYSDEAQKALSDCYYTDNKSKLKISAIADRTEIVDNVRTGRILLKNFEDMKLTIRPHFNKPGVKNPEYGINGKIADAKRIGSVSGIGDGFLKAKKQGSKAVIIDLHNIESKGRELDLQKIASGIVNRNEDFINKDIEECYVVWGDKCVKIEAKMFEGYDKKLRSDYITRVKKQLYNINRTAG